MLKMLKKTLLTCSLAAAAVVLAAPNASAEPVDYPGPTDETARFVSVFDLAAYGPRSDDLLLISPFGAAQTISCFSFHGQGGCWQTDPWGNRHALSSVQIPTGSSAGDARTVSVVTPF